MDATPLFSVVIPAYNHERCISDTIHSVLAQTEQDFEIIVVDDGSTDATREKIMNIQDRRLLYFYQANSGLPACSRNKGMSLSRGRYIALLDADDIWYKDKLAKCKEALETHTDIALVCHNEAIRIDNRIVRHSSYGHYAGDMYKGLLFKGNCLSPSAVVIRREVFFDMGYRFSERKELFTVEDYEFWLRISKGFKFYFLPDVLGEYNLSTSNTISANIERNANNMLALLEEHFRGFDSHVFGFMMARRRACVYCGAGRALQQSGRFKESRRWYAGSIRQYPLYLKGWAGLILSFMRIRR